MFDWLTVPCARTGNSKRTLSALRSSAPNCEIMHYAWLDDFPILSVINYQSDTPSLI